MADAHPARDRAPMHAHPPTVEVLVVEDCPHQAGAETLARDALDQAGYAGVHVVLTQVVKTGEDAARLGFTGSPSFRINGRGPFSGPDTPSLACRTDRTAIDRAPRGQMTRGQMTGASAGVAVDRPGSVRPRTVDPGTRLECHDVARVGVGLR